MRAKKSLRLNSSKKKILLYTLIPIAVIGVALGTALPLVYCSPGSEKNKLDLSSSILAIPPALDVNYDSNNNQTSNEPFSLTEHLPSDYTGVPHYTIHDSLGRLFINEDNKLVVKAGTNVGHINYKFDVAFPSDNKYKSREIENLNGDTVIINQSSLPNFTVSLSGWNGTIDYGSTVTATLGNTATSDYHGNFTYALVENEAGSFLSISDNKLILASGLTSKTTPYKFEIKATAIGDDNYKSTDSSSTYKGSITIDKINLPANISATEPSFTEIVYGYQSGVTSIGTFTPINVPTDYYGTPSYSLTSNPGGKLSIVDNHLILAIGADAGPIDYEYSVTFPADSNYKTQTVDGLKGTVEIEKADLPNIISANAPSFDPITYNYSGTQTSTNSFTSTNVPADYRGIPEYTLTENPGGWLSIDDSTPSAPVLKLKTGADAATINYEYSVTFPADGNYKAKTVDDLIGDVSIGKDSFNNFTITNLLDTDFMSTYTVASTTLSTDDIVPSSGTTVSYAFGTNTASSKLTLSGSTLTLAPGLAVGNYTYTIEATAANSNYHTKTVTSTTYSLAINALFSPNNMTADDFGNYTVYTSSAIAGYEGYHAFDGYSTSYWMSDVESFSYIMIMLESTKVLRSYSFDGSNLGCNPVSWEMWGSNDYVHWESLDIAFSTAYTTFNSGTLSNTKSFQWYSLDIYGSQSDQAIIAQIRLFGY